MFLFYLDFIVTVSIFIEVQWTRIDFLLWQVMRRLIDINKAHLSQFTVEDRPEPKIGGDASCHTVEQVDWNGD